MEFQPPNEPPAETPRKKRYVKAIGSKLGRLLFVVFGLFALLAVNSVYLASVSLLEWQTGRTYQDHFYLYNFLLHLVLGLLLITPVVVFGLLHLKNTYNRPNRRAVMVGYGLFGTALVLLATGIALMRVDGLIDLRDPALRRVTYWIHVLTPLVAAWLFILHRLAGRRIRWQVGLRWAGFAAAFAVVMLFVHAQDPRKWNVAGPKSGEKYFFPSLARTATGNFIPARTLMMDDYCKQCHAEAFEQHITSVHKASSFNNPLYAFSVRETRKLGLERDGSVQASRFCAGCHDPVPFFSGAFDQANFDDQNDPTAKSGLTCLACHAITNLNTNRGNGDYTIEESLQYPFTFSGNAALRWVNRQLIKAKPRFHKATYLKPFHRTAEFCGTCHKVHLPVEVNHYKWLRGQNHYDDFLLSGVSGHGAQSFYYPDKASTKCADCHMSLQPSNDFAARDFDGSGQRKMHQHSFPSGNTAIPVLMESPAKVNEAKVASLVGTSRVDLFGIREGGEIDGALIAPLRPQAPVLVPGQSYLLEAVIRTVKMGHHLTQGTADSNELWLDVTLTSGGKVVGRSGGRSADGTVDPWSHFVNVYMLDRDGNRIDRRNAQDIFVPLYNNQIPPGGADVVHYRFDVPRDLPSDLRVTVKLQYRKFDTKYMQYAFGKERVNDLPIVTIAADSLVFAVRGHEQGTAAAPASTIPEWQRWNDYGIGLFRKGTEGSAKGQLRQAEEVFEKVEQLKRPDGPVNLARVYLKEGRLDDAVQALERASRFEPPAYPWVVDWLTGLTNRQNGYLDQAIVNFTNIVESQYAEGAKRNFDFSRDYRVWNELARTLYDRSKLERGDARKDARDALLRRAAEAGEKTLTMDSENFTAHYVLNQVYQALGETAKAEEHRTLYEKYRLDDNARDHAVATARTNDAAADHAAEAIVIYDLQRPEARGYAVNLDGGAPGAPAATGETR